MGVPAERCSLENRALGAGPALGRSNPPSLRCQGCGHQGLLATGRLILVPPQAPLHCTTAPLTPQSQGGLSWLAEDPGEGHLLTALGTKNTKRPKKSLSHVNGYGARPSGHRLRSSLGLSRPIKGHLMASWLSGRVTPLLPARLWGRIWYLGFTHQ